MEAAKSLRLTVKPYRASSQAGAEGYAFFGFNDCAVFLRGMAGDPQLSAWTGDTEAVANRRYYELIPSDSHLAARFEEVFRERGDQFAPVEPHSR